MLQPARPVDTQVLVHPYVKIVLQALIPHQDHLHAPTVTPGNIAAEWQGAASTAPSVRLAVPPPTAAQAATLRMVL